VHLLQTTLFASFVHACWLVGFGRTACLRASSAVDQTKLQIRIHEMAFTRSRFGASRICVLLRRKGWGINLK